METEKACARECPACGAWWTAQGVRLCPECGNHVTETDGSEFIVSNGEEIERLRAALEFYAEPLTYAEGVPAPGGLSGDIPIDKDRGAVAREALFARR